MDWIKENWFFILFFIFFIWMPFSSPPWPCATHPCPDKCRQENRLITDRLYGLVWHPQYTGLFIALFGEALFIGPTFFLFCFSQ